MQLQCTAMCQYIKGKSLHVKSKGEFMMRTLSGSLNNAVKELYRIRR